jgi:hypothetical protein
MRRMDIRTNATTTNNDGFEVGVLVKPFSCEGKETWCDSAKRTQGALRIYPESEEIEVSIFNGCDPFVNDILCFVLKDRDIQMLIRNYYQKGRKHPYSIRHSFGQSGREDIYINFPDKTGLIVKGKHLLHISCFGKISGIKKIYIGDFMEMFAEGMQNESSFMSHNFCYTCKYEKPYFAKDATVKVSRLSL